MLIRLININIVSIFYQRQTSSPGVDLFNPVPRLQPLLSAVLHLGASSYVASAAPADELAAVDRIDILVVLCWSEDLVVISV
jgi:hypothetical protein